MAAENLNIGLAFLAGFISFISPCVLPLVPAYIGYMGGQATKEAGKENRQQFGTFIHGIFFVLGFTAFFVGFGLLTSAASSFLVTIGIDIPLLLTRLGGVAVIFFGLYVMKLLDPIFDRGLKITEAWKEKTIEPLIATFVIFGFTLAYFYWAFGADGVLSLGWALLLVLVVLALFRKPLNDATSLGDFWNRAISALQIALISDTRRQSNLMANENSGYGASFGLGIVFSAGWTPCVGPIYAAVLALAADASTTGSLFNAGVLLTAYSLGLGIPFLLTALAFNQSTSIMTSLKRNMRKVELFSGSLLLIIGVLILSGGLTDISNRFANNDEFIQLSARLEECTVSVFDGTLHADSYPGCVSDGEEKIGDLFIASVRYQGSNTPFAFAEAPSDAVVGLQEGNIAPNFTLTNLEGETVSLEDFRGQAVLINFWATWCGPCRIEMPEFNNVYNAVGDRGFTVLAVNLEESQEQVSGFADELGLDFPILLDSDGQINREYRVNSYPTSLIIDGNGIIHDVHRGGLSEQDLRDSLQAFEPNRFVFDAAPADAVTGIQEGNIAPNFTLTNLEGETVSLEDFRGQAVLINFWATWCGPCRTEMPAFNNVYNALNSRGFTVLAVNLEESQEQVSGFVDELELDFPIVLDSDGQINRQFRVNSYPTSILVDGNGIIHEVHRGGLTEGDLRESLEIFEPGNSNVTLAAIQ